MYANADQLIKAVKLFPVLYDISHVDYGISKVEEEKWKVIAENLKFESGQHARALWMKLRDCHREALRRQEKKRQSSGSSNVRIKPWTYQDQMSFLIPFMTSAAVNDQTDIVMLIDKKREEEEEGEEYIHFSEMPVVVIDTNPTVEHPEVDDEPTEIDIDIEPPEIDIEPQEIDIELHDIDIKPKLIDIEPQVIDIEPQEIDIEHQEIDIESQEIDIEPHYIDIKPELIDLEPPVIDIEHPEIDIEPLEMDVKPKLINIRAPEVHIDNNYSSSPKPTKEPVSKYEILKEMVMNGEDISKGITMELTLAPSSRDSSKLDVVQRRVKNEKFAPKRVKVAFPLKKQGLQTLNKPVMNTPLTRNSTMKLSKYEALKELVLSGDLAKVGNSENLSRNDSRLATLQEQFMIQNISTKRNSDSSKDKIGLSKYQTLQKRVMRGDISIVSDSDSPKTNDRLQKTVLGGASRVSDSMKGKVSLSRFETPVTHFGDDVSLVSNSYSPKTNSKVSKYEALKEQVMSGNISTPVSSENEQEKPKDTLRKFFDSMYNLTKAMPQQFQGKIRRKIFEAIMEAEEEIHSNPGSTLMKPSGGSYGFLC